MSLGFLFIAVPLAKSDIPTTLRNLRNAFRELWRRKQVLPYFVRSEENVADGMAKNQPEKLFKEHEPLIMKGRLPRRREDVEMALLGLTGEPTEGTGSGVSDRAGIG